MTAVRIGCAGWAIPPAVQDRFPPGASHLERYARVFGASEINSSFHRPHRESTWARWAGAVPPGFDFCAKLPKAITHAARLANCDALVDEFIAQARGLGPALRCLLVQLPPSLAFDAAVAGPFFEHLRAVHAGPVVLEPRHASWFDPPVDAWLAGRRVARVLADPVRHAGGERPGGWPDLVYLRLHGSPRMYYSPYGDDTLVPLAQRLRREREAGREAWCIFDNTAGQEAMGNALRLQALLAQT